MLLLLECHLRGVARCVYLGSSYVVNVSIMSHSFFLFEFLNPSNLYVTAGCRQEVHDSCLSVCIIIENCYAGLL
jgi:hypothetical protein